jgi:hypothetical protein
MVIQSTILIIMCILEYHELVNEITIVLFVELFFERTL